MSVENSQKEQKAEIAASGSLLVVNMRGLVNTRAPVLTTLRQLSIARRFNATIVPDDQVHRGMLNLAKEHVSWCKVDAATAEKLLRSRSEKSTGSKLSESELKASNAEYATFGRLASELESGGAKLGKICGMRPFFRLSPPKGGFKRSTRRKYRQGGVLGQNQDLPKLVDRMI